MVKAEVGPVAMETTEFAAFAALDWGDKEHCWVLQEAGSTKREKGKLPQTPEGIEEWAGNLAKRFGERTVAVAMEQSRGALVCALSRYRHLKIFPIPPAASAGFRAFASPSGSKDDSRDAGMLLDMLMWHREKFRPLCPDTEETRKLQALVEMRRQLVDQKTATTNRITAQLKLCFPQVLEWFDEVDSPLVMDFVRRWPTLPQLQAAKQETVLEFLHGHNCRSAERNRQRLAQMKKAQALSTDPAVIEPAVLMIRTLMGVVEGLRSGISEMEGAIDRVCGSHPDFEIFASFPGAGPALAPRLLAAFGSDRSRFPSAAEVQRFSGIAPVVSQSGKSMWVHFRWACPKFLRQTFHEFAGVSIQFCEWARAYYDQQRAKSKGHHAAVRALAYKWIRILYACWRDRKPYDERLGADRLAKRSTPLSLSGQTATATVPPAASANSGKSVEFVFKTVAGFSKVSEISY